MRRKLWFSAFMAALGASLLVAASFANAASTSSAAKRGGTMRLNMSATDVDFTDPSLAYGTISWQIEYATALKLVNYPDKAPPAGGRLQPEAAVGMPIVSNNGKQYKFTIKKGLKLSNGETVTAKNFQKSIFRALTKSMQSPAATFIQNIVGAQAMIDGKANSAAGVVAKGNTLTIKLTQPDGGLLSKLGMPFFQALSLGMKNDPKGIDSYPSGGPYVISSRIPNRRIVLTRNKFYKGKRPANVDTFDITVNTNLDQSLLQVKSNQIDYDMGGLPPTAHAGLASQYGTNKGQYQVHPLVETDYVALNTSRPSFGTAATRKAANFAIDRPAMLRVRGAFAGKRTDQILPPGMGGFKDVKAYPLAGANYAKAKALAGSKCGSIRLDSTTSATGQALAQVLKYNLTQMGCDVNVKLFQGFQLYVADGTKGEPFDAAIAGWNQDYPDPYDFLDILLNGNNIHADNNNNLAYFNSAGVNKQLDQANRKVGPARYRAYGNLDVSITKNYAPWAAYDNRNEREFVAKRVGGYLFQPANASADLNTFFVK
ncbi:MAG: peptide/nickel transport system substrate-binding protein [Gaiellaceae bacterium]|nr:peptide/nickel transport system substrate-binding protein [Gaiellaceae bacterium]